jgi:hypothetical protein
MSWYQDAEAGKSQTYTPPKITQQKLDVGGNYVAASDANGNVKTLGNSIHD